MFSPAAFFPLISAGGGGSPYASVGTLGTNTAFSVTSLAITTSATLESGNMAIVAFAFWNESTSDGDNSEVTSVVDSASNTYTKIGEHTNTDGSANDGVTLSVWYTVATSQLTSGGTITGSWTNSNNAVASAWEFTVSDTPVLQTPIQTVSDAHLVDPSAMTISGLSSAEYLFVRWVARRIALTTLTPTTNYTGFSLAVTPSGPGNDKVSVSGEFRILTGTGDTSDPAGSNDNALACGIFAAFK